MPRRVRLEFDEHRLAGSPTPRRVMVAHGASCVLVQLLEPERGPLGPYRAIGAIVLDPREARALGRRLIQQADVSERLDA